MAPESESVPVEVELDRLIRAGDGSGLRTLLRALSPSEVARAVSRLADDVRAALVEQLEPREASAVLESIPQTQAVATLALMAPATAAEVVHELPSAERADLLGELDPAAASAILAAMEPQAAHDARELAGYADDVAGGLMIKEYLAYPDTFTVGRVVSDLREHADRYRDYQVQYVFVTAPGRVLVGVLRLRDLLLARAETPIRQLMIHDPLTVRDMTGLDELRAFFDRRPYFGAPVVDGQGRLVGIVRRAAVQQALAERSEDAFLKTLGIVGGEELRTMPVLRRSTRRLAWLSLNIVLNVIAASVIALYQDTVAAVISLAVFLPIISDMSGCSGNQAVAVSMRELALGLVRPYEVLRVWWKEISVGLVNGAALGGLIAAVAWLWKGNVYLGLVVGAAMGVNTLVAVSIGGAVPLLLRRAGFDPALASGPILTTVTDVCGFFLLLSLAGAALPLLT